MATRETVKKGNGNGRARGRATQAAAVFDERDVFIAWIRGEFAAANAIIDALCNHLRIVGEPHEYDFAAVCIQQRRYYWLSLLQAQHYYSIADIVNALTQVASAKKLNNKISQPSFGTNNNTVNDNHRNSHFGIGPGTETQIKSEQSKAEDGHPSKNSDSNCNSNLTEQTKNESDRCPKEKLCRDSIFVMKKEGGERKAMVKTIENFVASEVVDGQLVNIVKGLELHENVFDSSELLELTGFVDELRTAGQGGKLGGETFLSFKRPMKGNGREMIQFGVPVVHHLQGQDTNASPKDLVEPIPTVLEQVIDRLLRLNLISGNIRPNCCLINFFNEGDYSQPHMTPLHFERPFYTISLISECTLVFGRVITMDRAGDFKGSFELSLVAGSMLAMQGCSVDIARHAICSSLKRRITITFAEVKPKKANNFQPSFSGLPYPPSLSVIPWPVVQRSNGNMPVNSHSQGRETNSAVLKPCNSFPATGTSIFPQIPHLVAAEGIQPLVAGIEAQAVAYPPFALSAARWSAFSRPTTGTGVFLPCEGSISEPDWHLSLSQQQQGLVLLPEGDPSSVTDKVYAKSPRSSYSTSKSSKATASRQLSLNRVNRYTENSCFLSSKYPVSAMASTVASNASENDAGKDSMNGSSKLESDMDGRLKDDKMKRTVSHSKKNGC